MPSYNVEIARNSSEHPEANCLTDWPTRAWFPRVFLTVLASTLLASQVARSQEFGPGTINQTISRGQSATVVGSTQLSPPTGSSAAAISGPGTVTFNPAAGSLPGPITVTTTNASAIVVSGSGQLVINPSGSAFQTTITTTGNNAYGINLTSGQHTESLNNAFITTSGANSDGIRIENPNNLINATDVTVTTTGAGASALALISGGGSMANFTNGTLQSAGGPTIRIQGGTNKAINLTDASVLAGDDGRWLYVTSAGAATITASSSTLAGTAITDSGSTSNLILQDDTVWTVTGNSNVTNLTNNNSLIDFALQGGFKTLTTVNYGGEGGTLGLNTSFGPTIGDQKSDVLQLNGGQATGTTQIEIKPINPDNAVPTEGNGILLVDAINGATTAQNAFFIDNLVAAGPYEYELLRGGINGTDPQNWYLRSGGGITDPCEPPPGGGGEDGNGGNGGGGNGGGNGGTGGGGVSGSLRPEVSLYSNSSVLTWLYGSMVLDTLHERKGDDWRNGPGEQPIWGRLIGQHGLQRCSVNREKDISYDMFSAQGGIDLYYGEGRDGGNDRAGVYGAIGTASGNSHLFDVDLGSNDNNAYTIGGYWTHYGKEGWYIDALLQGTWYDIEARSNRPYSLSTDGLGIGASLEAGYPFVVSDDVVIEPQAQLSYQHINIDDANDGAATVNYSDVDSLVGRVGARVAKTWKLESVDADPRQMTGWLRASYAYEFLADPTTSFSSGTGPVPFTGDYSGSSLIFDAGLDGSITSNVSLYGSLNYRISLNDLGYAIGGKIGLKMKW